MERRARFAAVGVILTLLACQLSEADGFAHSAVRRVLRAVSRQLRTADSLACNASSDCGVNERCVSDVDGSLNVSYARRLGRCVCLDGYTRLFGVSCSPSASASTLKPAAVAPQAPAANDSSSEGRIVFSEITTSTPHDQTAVAMQNSTSLKSLSAVAVTTTLAATTKVGDSGGTLTSPSTSAGVTLQPIAKRIYRLNVSAGEDVVLRSPNNSVELNARVSLPALLQNESLRYAWTFDRLPSNVAADGQSGVMRGLTDPKLKLTKLMAGVYRVKLVVESDNSFGESFVNITVLPPARINQPPKAVIQPSDQHVTHGNVAVLDGSGSTDDESIASYLWEVVSAPVAAVSNIQFDGGRERPMLQLRSLLPGAYTIRLTVTDSDGVQNSTTARLQVVKEVDHPPEANAGSDVIISMPLDEVVLMGNSSTDDKGIVVYEWTKAVESPAVDLSGARTPFLKLSKLQPGHYTFTLKVTDVANQVSTDDVQVFVKEELNRAPVAVVTNASILVRLVPDASVRLDGSPSWDDHEIVRYEWSQLGGPSTARLSSSNQAVATAAGLQPGRYQFRLTVHDAEQLSSSTQVDVEAIANVNRRPVARACGNMTVKLPKLLLTLDGSQSSDEDGHIVSHRWTRELSSPAAGDVVDGSDHEAVLRLTGPVVGRYTWLLTVTDNEGLTATDQCTVNVTHGANDLDIVEVFFEVPIEDFSEADKESIASGLVLLLRQPGGVSNTAAATASDSKSDATSVNILRISTDGLTGLLVVSFVVLDGSPGSGQTIRRGPDAARMLKEKLRRNADVLELKVHSVSTLICQNNCSGHGFCNRFTKACVCDRFWMQNVLRNYMDGDSNCDWSVVYVVVIGFGAMAGLVLLLGICTCACRKRCCSKDALEKRRSYQFFKSPEADDGKSSLLPKRNFTLSDDFCNNNISKSDPNKRHQSLLLDDSELSSDEDIMFVNSSSASAKAKWSPTAETEETAALTGGRESRA